MELYQRSWGRLGLGRWGDGRGSPVNKLGPEPGNHLLLIELVGPFFFFFLARGASQGVHWPFLMPFIAS